MFSTLNYVLGKIEAEEKDGRVIIGGFSVRLLLKEISKVYGSRIENGMFYLKTMNRVEIPYFFVFDFYEVLKSLPELGKGRYFKPQMTKKLLAAMEELPLIKAIKEPVKPRFNRKNVNRLKRAPLKHQLEFFDAYEKSTFSYKLKGFILASAPGSGKTYMGFYKSEMLETTKTIIFSPNNAVHNVWHKTILEEFHSIPSHYVYGQNLAPKGDERYWIFNHENLKFAFEYIKKYFKPGEKINIVIDECHAFNDMNSDRTNLLIEICKYLKCKDTLFMSGTPFKALGAEILPFLYVCDPFFNSATEKRFKHVFGNNGLRALNILAARIGRSSFKVEKKDVIRNERHEIELRVTMASGKEFTMEALRKKMETFIRERTSYYMNAAPRLEQEFLTILQKFEYTLKTPQEKMLFANYRRKIDLIRRSRNIGELSEDIKEVNLYERKVIIPALSNEDKHRFRETRAVYKYVALKIQGEALGRILGKERTRCNLEILRNLDNSKAYCDTLEWDGIPFSMGEIFTTSKTKAIFFTDYIEVLEEGVKLFKASGLKPMAVYAETNKDLTSIIKTVEKDPKANPIIATYKSLSTAVPLTMLDTCVFLNEPFRAYIREQAEARLDRLGQTNDLLYYSVVLDTGDEPNISTRSKEILKWSKEMVEILLGTKLTDDPDIVEESFLENFNEVPKMVEKIKNVLSW